MKKITKEGNRIIIRKNGVVVYASKKYTNSTELIMAYSKVVTYEDAKALRD